jgi:hypothetical protein
MNDETIDDAAGRKMWARAAPPGAGCPDDLALAAYADNRADAATVDAVEGLLADCREARCLCLAAVAAARQPAIEPVPLNAVVAARALVTETPVRRVWRVGQWAAAAAGILIAAQIGFSLGVSTESYRDLAQFDETTEWAGLASVAEL